MGKIYEKKSISFFCLRSRFNRLANRKKFILPLETLKLWRTWSVALSYLQFFKVGKIMVSNYGHLMGTQGISIINNFENFFPKVCSLTPPTIKYKMVTVIVVCTRLSLWGSVCGGGGGGVLSLLPSFQIGRGLGRISIFRDSLQI